MECWVMRRERGGLLFAPFKARSTSDSAGAVLELVMRFFCVDGTWPKLLLAIEWHRKAAYLLVPSSLVI